MTAQQLKSKIIDILKGGYFNEPDDAVFVLDGPNGNLHVVVVSPKLHGRRLAEKEDLIISDLMQQLEKDQWGRITLSVGVSPREITAMT